MKKLDQLDDFPTNLSANEHFQSVVERAFSRRGFLKSGLGLSAAAFLSGSLTACTSDDDTPAAGAPATPAPPAGSLLGFEGIATSTADDIVVAAGYTATVFAPWGTPLFSSGPGSSWAGDASETAADQARQVGDNHDGLHFFPLTEGNNDEGLLVMNHEYTNVRWLFSDGQVDSLDDANKDLNAHGISVIHIRRTSGRWEIVTDSTYNRRITGTTPMLLTGPAAGDTMLQTSADPTGTLVFGTLNNCGNGYTPWGTYLTCEENFNGYFGATAGLPADQTIAAGYTRYGINGTGFDYNYHLFDARFDVSRNPNEPHRAGYVVEIDPSNPDSTPIKRTALGRFKHENAEVVLAPDGRVVVYMGDDERGEFMYKWLSRDVYTPGGDTSTLLSEGQLFAAKFNDDMTGEWLALTPAATALSAAEIAIFTRTAASAVGATTMDRPEWIAVNPTAVEAYCCLTNNSRRGATNSDGALRTNAGGDAMAVNAPNPRATNDYGQIVRWRPHGDTHAATTFDWDLYVMAGNPGVHADGPYAGTANINAGNLFNSPDGMQIDTTGLIWIQTDGDDSNEGDFAGMGNNQMLAGDPVTGEIRRFLTGPKGSEVTGLTWSSDRRTMFVGIQHPGAPFPDGDGSLPRSAIIVVKRDDNALVG